MAVNDSRKERKLCVDLGDFSAEASCQVIRTSGSLEKGEQWKKLDDEKLTDNILSTTLKPYSVTTFIIRTKE